MDGPQQHVSHRPSRGPHARKRSSSKPSHAPGQNRKAFTVAHPGRKQRETQYRGSVAHRGEHGPEVRGAGSHRTGDAPLVVAVQGPPGSGKSTLVRSLVKRWTRERVPGGVVEGPVTMVAGRSRRVTLLECGSGAGDMVDVAKVADVVVLLINADKGFEMETFEFINILQVHGFPKVVGVLTHLEGKDTKTQRKLKKKIKARFWVEVYRGAKLFYCSGVSRGKYPKREVTLITQALSVIKSRPSKWRAAHPYVLLDRFEEANNNNNDDSNNEEYHDNDDVTTIVGFGYVRGTSLRTGARVHFLGVGDFDLNEVAVLPDPCPLPEKKQRALLRRETLLYAPMTPGLGNVMYDKNAVFVTLPAGAKPDVESEALAMVRGLRDEGGDDAEEGEEEEEAFELVKGGGAFSLPVRRGGLDEEEEEEVEPEEESDGNEGWSSDDSEDRAREKSLMERVYGSRARGGAGQDTDESSSEDEDEDEDFFQPVRGGDQIDKLALRGNAPPTLLPSKALPDSSRLASRLVENNDVDDYLDDMFVRSGAAAQSMGDFEDLEVKPEGGEEGEDDAGEGEEDEGEEDEGEEDEGEEEKDYASVDFEEQRRLAALRKAQKMDEATTAPPPTTTEEEEEVDDRSSPNKKKRGPAVPLAQVVAEETTEYQSEIQALLKEQENLDESEFAHLPEDQRVLLEGFRPGAYVRVVLRGVPREFLEQFHPRSPLILGGLAPHETQMTFLRARVKKHRWFPKKVLKTNDPLVFSIGWRRFQSMPLYSIEDENETRHRLLKYTPEHMHCVATFYGPAVAPNTGVLAFQNAKDRTESFRVSLTGVVVELDKSTQVVKKLKLVGHPSKVFKNTAFIKDMFSSELEVAKHEGAVIRTVSGLRGVIKKALPGENGLFRASFEDKILKSDIVFLRAWVNVEPKTLYNPMCSLLEDWDGGMRTVAQLRHDLHIPIPTNPDSVYRPQERPERRFNPLHVPESLQARLPFKSKPKQMAPRSSKGGEMAERRAVIHSTPEERKVYTLIQQLNTVRAQKEKARKEATVKRVKQHHKNLEAMQHKFEPYVKDQRKREMRAAGLKQGGGKRAKKGED